MLSFLELSIICAMRYMTISGVYYLLWGNPWNTSRKLQRAGKMLALFQSFIRSTKKHFYMLQNQSKFIFTFSSSFSDNHGQNSWDTFAFPGSSFLIHTCPTPPLTPQTTLDMCFSNLLIILNFQWVFGNKVKNCSFLHP